MVLGGLERLALLIIFRIPVIGTKYVLIEAVSTYNCSGLWKTHAYLLVGREIRWQATL